MFTISVDNAVDKLGESEADVGPTTPGANCLIFVHWWTNNLRHNILWIDLNTSRLFTPPNVFSYLCVRALSMNMARRVCSQVMHRSPKLYTGVMHRSHCEEHGLSGMLAVVEGNAWRSSDPATASPATPCRIQPRQQRRRHWN